MVMAMLRAKAVAEELVTPCGDLSLGSLAEWVTAVIALVAAVAAVVALILSGKANGHARNAAAAAVESSKLTDKAYRDDVRVRDEAQARLVYSTLDAGHSVILAGTELPEPLVSGAELVPLPDMVYVHGNGQGARYVSENARTVVVGVHNRSMEIISSIRVALFNASDKREIGHAPGWIVLLPNESRKLEFLVPFGDTYYLPDIAFRDSTGKYWSRRGFDPIAPLRDERRNQFGLPKAP